MINLNEYAYQLKEQGLNYIQIGFVMKELAQPDQSKSSGTKGTNRRDNSPITVLPRLA